MSTQTKKCYLAIDLGASSGRVIAGCYDNETITLDEVHRFSNGATNVQGRLYWAVFRLFDEIKIGLKKAAAKYGEQIESVAVDTWGVDYALFDKTGAMLKPPRQYRDERTNGMQEVIADKHGLREVYEATGIQFMFFNTLLQITSEVELKDPAHEVADRLLFMPDIMSYWLSGVMAVERSIASTSQMLDPRTGDWADSVIDSLKIPRKLFGPTIAPGSVLGNILPSVAEETGLSENVKVVAVGSHDTASAVAGGGKPGASLEDNNWAYLSSGTWSLMGIESREPIINDRSFEFGLTNELGVEGSVRVLKNIAGLWLVQECVRVWKEAGREYSWDELTELAEAATPLMAVIDPDDESFATPGDMPARIQDYCRKTNQTVPETPGEIIAVALSSLALKYRDVMESLVEITGEQISTLHIIGGGSNNRLLNQFTADCLGVVVRAGPAEATSLGNIMMQMVADGSCESVAKGRELVAASFELETFEPKNSNIWDDAYAVHYK